MQKSTWVATPNIAVVKYWGRKDSQLNLPANNSISVTMDEALSTKTTVEFSEKYKEDELVLNKMRASESDLGRAVKVLDAIRKMAKIKYRARVESQNNFPTAAGLASSASGFAALACAASDAAGLKASARQLSIFARLGSGSACRSVLGGFVEWKAGKKKDGSDSYAVQVASNNHWPQLRNVIAVVNPGRKKVGSSEGMELTANTSPLYKERIRTIGKTIAKMKRAIIQRDLQSFLELTMRESSHLHAVMLDTFPPIIYLNDISRQIIEGVHDLNAKKGRLVAGYTFDAGPNAHIYTLEAHVGEVEDMLSKISGVKKVIVCKVGAGPRRLPSSESLF